MSGQDACTPDADPRTSPVSLDPVLLCPGCNGAGSIVVSLCCGRGCATCTGDGMMQAVECYGCKGRGYR